MSSLPKKWGSWDIRPDGLLSRHGMSRFPILDAEGHVIQGEYMQYHVYSVADDDTAHIEAEHKHGELRAD